MEITLIILTLLVLLIILILFIMGNIFVKTAIKTNVTKKFVLDKNKDTQDELESVIRIRDCTWLKEINFKTCKTTNSSLDNTKLHYYIIKNETNPSNKYVTVLHGFSGNHVRVSFYAKLFYELGYNIIAIDLRGHGKSKAPYIGMGIQDAHDLKDIITDFLKDNPDSQISLFGISMGAATVLTSLLCDLPSNVKCIIEDSGFSSCIDEFKYQLKYIFKLPSIILPFASIISKIKAHYSFYDMSALEGVKSSNIPILFIHGTSDTFVPVKMCTDMYDSCPSEKELLIIENAGHVKAVSIDEEKYILTCKNFLRKFL